MEEDKDKKGIEEEEDTLPPEEPEEPEEDLEDDEPEEGDEPEEEPEDDKDKDIDYEKDLQDLEESEKKRKQPEKPTRSEREKAERALHFNARRLQELGGDPAKILKLKPEEGEAEDKKSPALSEIDRRFAERDARALAKSEAEAKLILKYMELYGLKVEDAYILANKGKLQRSIIEAKRAGIRPKSPELQGKKRDTFTVPERTAEEKSMLERRGYKFNEKTKTYQGKFYEEYYDPKDGLWKSRKIAK